MTTVLTLDMRGARRALRLCVQLLLRRVDEDEIEGATHLAPADPQAREGGDRPDQEAGTHRGIIADEPGNEKARRIQQQGEGQTDRRIAC